MFLLPFFFFSCNNLQDEIIQEETSLDDLDIINNLGFDNSSAVDMGEYFIIEGDIKLMKEELPKYQQTSTRQAYSNFIVRRSYISDIKIQISSDLNNTSDWRNAILAVMQSYNEIGSGINMHEVSSNPDITISYGPINAWGQGEFPTADNKPGRTIKISNSNPNANNLSLQQKIFLIAHEIGHNLGFRHTDYLTAYPPYKAEGTGEYGAHHIPDTPTGAANNQDPNSVFNSGNFYGRVIPWNGFSNFDIMALRWLYPAPLPSPPIYNIDIEMILDSNAPRDYDCDITLSRTEPANAPSSWNTSHILHTNRPLNHRIQLRDGNYALTVSLIPEMNPGLFYIRGDGKLTIRVDRNGNVYYIAFQWGNDIQYLII